MTSREMPWWGDRGLANATTETDQRETLAAGTMFLTAPDVAALLLDSGAFGGWGIEGEGSPSNLAICAGGSWTQDCPKVSLRPRDETANDSDLVRARDLRAARLEEHVRKSVANWPPLTPAQVDRLAGLLRPW